MGVGTRPPGNGAISEALRRGQGGEASSIVGLGASAPGKGALRSSLGVGVKGEDDREKYDVEIVGPFRGGTIESTSDGGSANSIAGGRIVGGEGEAFTEGSTSSECVDGSGNGGGATSTSGVSLPVSKVCEAHGGVMAKIEGESVRPVDEVSIAGSETFTAGSGTSVLGDGTSIVDCFGTSSESCRAPPIGSCGASIAGGTSTTCGRGGAGLGARGVATISGRGPSRVGGRAVSTFGGRGTSRMGGEGCRKSPVGGRDALGVGLTILGTGTEAFEVGGWGRVVRVEDVVPERGRDRWTGGDGGRARGRPAVAVEPVAVENGWRGGVGERVASREGFGIREREPGPGELAPFSLGTGGGAPRVKFRVVVAGGVACREGGAGFSSSEMEAGVVCGRIGGSLEEGGICGAEDITGAADELATSLLTMETPCVGPGGDALRGLGTSKSCQSSGDVGTAALGAGGAGCWVKGRASRDERGGCSDTPSEPDRGFLPNMPVVSFLVIEGFEATFCFEAESMDFNESVDVRLRKNRLGVLESIGS